MLQNWHSGLSDRAMTAASQCRRNYKAEFEFDDVKSNTFVTEESMDVNVGAQNWARQMDDYNYEKNNCARGKDCDSYKKVK